MVFRLPDGGPVRVRTSNTALDTPTPAELEEGELALNAADGTLYFQTSSGGISTAGTPDAPSDGGTYARKDGDWIDIEEAANLQVRRGTASEVASITPLEGEPVWNTTNDVLAVGDGSTAGGIQVGHKLLDAYGGGLTLSVLSAEYDFPQVQYSSPVDGEIGLTIPANSLVLGSAYRLGSAGLEDDGVQPDGFALGWSGDTDALFSGQTASANASGVQMLAAPIWLTSSKAVSLEPPGASAGSLTGVIRLSVYIYSLVPSGTFTA
jgi:hypothetical protein